ncbi:MAG: hypothetical protein FGM32_07850 [Candidatus Kapabacteria bacterium]|nr:hypothetical protein [Candidatus Kapabacteria bacterium]
MSVFCFYQHVRREHVLCLMALLLWLPASAQRFPAMSVEKLGFAAPGYFLFVPNSLDTFGFLDHTGEVNRKTYGGIAANIRTYGDTILVHSLTSGTFEAFIRRNKNLAIIDTLRPTAPYRSDFHEGKIWSDSSYVILGEEERTIDLSKIVTGGRTNAVVLGAVIQERTFKGTLLFEWKSLDHINVTDATEDIDLTQSRIDYIHVNSIDRDLSGNLVVSCRHTDEVICISRTNGAVLWRLGGQKSRGNQFTFANDQAGGFTGFSHQHSVIVTSRGTVMMFDNGNLKPEPRASRVVEYSLNVQVRIATKTWEYVPAPAVYASSMGSIEELENGNLLMGFGNVREPATNTIIAQELTPEGRIVAEILNQSGTAVSAYRVHKTKLGMCGFYKKPTSTGRVLFKTADSTTYISANILSVTTPTGIVVERHPYAPKAIRFAKKDHCFILPMRWVIRMEDTTAVTGELSFETGSMKIVESPTQVRLFRRATEGQGSFSQVDGTFDANQRTFVVKQLQAGEYLLAYEACSDPLPSTPVNGAFEVSVLPTLEWTPAAIVESYDVEIADNPAFTQSRIITTTTGASTSVAGLANNRKYYWRVRRKTKTLTGAWSYANSFTTQLGVSTLISPVTTGKDTVAWLPNQSFRWTKATGAKRYRIVVGEPDAEVPAIDDTTDTESFNAGSRLKPNALYSWVVYGIRDSIKGRSSERAWLFTAPAAPDLIAPVDDAMMANGSATDFSWDKVPGAVRYSLVIRSASDSAILFRDTAIKTSFARVGNLPSDRPMVWNCTAVGRYGAGPASDTHRLTLYSTAPLMRPATITPKGSGVAGDTSFINFTWSQVPDASRYRLQVFRQDAPRTAVIDTTVTSFTVRLRGFAPSTSFFWRAMASNDRSSSQWSDTARFITSSIPGNVGLHPTFPEMSARNVPTQGELRFTVSDSYVGYEAAICTDPEFTSSVLTITGAPNGTAAYTGLKERTQYFWRVVGTTKEGARQTGPTAEFTTTDPATKVAEDGTIGTFIHVVANRSRLLITGTSPQSSTCSIYDVLGRLIATKTLVSGSLWEFDQPLSEGVVVVVITTPQDVPLWKGALLISQ